VKRNVIFKILKSHRKDLNALGIKKLYLFGSFARNEAHNKSDIDLLVDFREPVGIFHFLRARRRLENILGAPVDLVTRPALRKELRDTILKECINAA
jgi:uncharacterized protein